jgi:hypothetical protein
LWTQRNYRHSYAIVTAHVYVDHLCEQKVICLGIEEVPDHKSETIYNVVAKILDSYGQQIDKVGVINTDNASANLKAFR